jgi:hypothetical protein
MAQNFGRPPAAVLLWLCVGAP